MKKDNLLFLCNNLSNISMKIMTSLTMLKNLNKNVENDFIDFCVKHKDIMDEDIYDRTLQLFLNISYIIPDNTKQEIYELLSELYENEYITSSEDFNIILECLIEISIIPLAEIVDIYSLSESGYDIDNITFDILKIYINQFNDIKNLSYDKMYSQNISKINENFLTVLYDLNNTECDITEDLYSSYFNRISSYIQIIRNPEIYSMSPKRYEAFCESASYIRSSKELNKFYKRVKLLNKKMSCSEFSKKIEELNDEVNDNFISLLHKNLGIKKSSDEEVDSYYIPNTLTNEVVNDEINKILSKKNDKNIVIF